jgi:hypothetical protein
MVQSSLLFHFYIKRWPCIVRYDIYNVQDYSVLYNNAVHLATCEDWHYTHMWKAHQWPHHFTKGVYLYIYFYQYLLFRGWSYIGTGNRAECTTIFQLFRGGKFVIGGRNRSSLESDSNRLIYISLVLD